MKKVFFLLAILFATASFSQSTPETQPAGITPCPPCPTITSPVVQQPIPVKKTYRRIAEKTPSVVTTITNSGNTTINNYYPVQGGFAVEKSFSVSDWITLMGIFAVFLILLLLSLFTLLDWYRSRNLNVSNKGQNSNAPIVNVYPPSAPAPAPIVVTPISEAEIDKAMNAARKEGCAFSRTTNGYDIHFLPSKNTEKPASNKEEETK